MHETETLKQAKADSQKRIAAASLVQSETTGCAVELLLGSETHWPTRDLLRILAEATDILMSRYDYDGHGWERLHYAMEQATVRAEEIEEAMRILHNDHVESEETRRKL